MTGPEHTATPWSTAPCSNGGAILRRGGAEAWKHPQGMLQIVPAEDAEFIVRAVNSHYELLAVAKRCLRIVEDGSLPDWDWLREVIAKAEGA